MLAPLHGAPLGPPVMTRLIRGLVQYLLGVLRPDGLIREHERVPVPSDARHASYALIDRTRLQILCEAFPKPGIRRNERQSAVQEPRPNGAAIARKRV